jgi:hypothetical protein
VVEGLGRPGISEGKRWDSKLDEKVLMARGWGEGSGMSAVDMVGGVVPFYRGGEAAGRVVMAAVVRFKVVADYRSGGEEEATLV